MITKYSAERSSQSLMHLSNAALDSSLILVIFNVRSTTQMNNLDIFLQVSYTTKFIWYNILPLVFFHEFAFNYRLGNIILIS